MSPIISPRRSRSQPGERSQPALDVLGGRDEPSAQQAGGPDTTEPRRPALRIVSEESREIRPVLLVGGDASRRAILCAEFSATLPSHTPFSEADEVADVLECAASSRMVILAGDLVDADAESLMRLLGRRHPLLPVISVDTFMPAAAGAHG